MICASCATENRPGRRFCAECAAPLAATCPACGAANESGDKFCGACASPLGLTTEGQPQRSVEAAAASAERRVVTVLFADLVDFTPYAEARDPETVQETLSRYFAAAREIIGAHGGTVEKFIGDAVMALWGAPQAHEDDAERAIRAGLELVRAIRQLGDGIDGHVGIATGEAAVNLGASGEGLVTGDIVNTAARLQTAAPPGAVLVGEATRHAAGPHIAFDPAGELTLKGKSSPVPAWRAVRVVAGGDPAAPRELEPAFVGREHELRLMSDVLDVATA